VNQRGDIVLVFTRLEDRDGWLFPVNDHGEIDWMCPKCGHEHTSCCGNSHFPCTKSPQYGGECTCTYLDSLGSRDHILKEIMSAPDILKEASKIKKGGENC